MPEQTMIRCLIVDDEPPAREVIRRYIEDIPNLELAGECPNAIQAFTFLQQSTVDLVFLDIRMPQLTGTDFLKTIKNPPRVIFTTAYTEYAIQGYELDAVDYLLKPVPFDRFLRAVNKVFHQVSIKPGIPVLSQEKQSDPFVYFRADRKMVKIMLQDIHYVESMKDYVKVFTAQGTIITKQSITSVEAMLPEKSFMRIHRSYIVSLDRVKSFTAELIEIDKAEIPIGKLYRTNVLKVLG
jgi:DNA-binding LytR/AlgR family response regulator